MSICKRGDFCVLACGSGLWPPHRPLGQHVRFLPCPRGRDAGRCRRALLRLTSASLGAAPAQPRRSGVRAACQRLAGTCVAFTDCAGLLCGYLRGIVLAEECKALGVRWAPGLWLTAAWRSPLRPGSTVHVAPGPCFPAQTVRFSHVGVAVFSPPTGT